MVNLSTRIRNLEFDFPLFNASGVNSVTKEELLAITKSEAGGVLFKTMTLQPREGNPEPRYVKDNVLTINSMGLPNLGVDFYCDLVKEFDFYKKPKMASISGFTEQEFEILFEKVNSVPFDGIEANLSCPNLEGKDMFAYDIPKSIEIMKKMRDKTDKVLGAKLPPYVEQGKLQEIAEGFVSIGLDFVCLTNTFPLSTAIDIKSETVRIKPNGGIAGLSGEYIKPITLAHVILFNQYSKGKIAIVATGGITSGSDMYEYILAGATVCSTATQLWREGPEVFARIKKELEVILSEKGVENLADKIGHVKFLN